MIQSYPDRQTWLAARRSGIGGSDAAAILGEDPYKSPYQVWSEKVFGVEDEAGEAADWGNVLEPVIVSEYVRRFNRPARWNDEFAVARHKEHAWWLATLDATQHEPCGTIVGAEGALQIKTTSAWLAKDWKDGPPIKHQIQLQHEMAAADLTWGSLVVLVGGQKLLGPFDFERDDDYLSRVAPVLEDFWRLVQDRKPPPVDHTEACARALRKLYPEDDGGTTELREDDELVVDRLLRAKEREKKVKDAIRKLENRLKESLAEAAVGVLPDGRRVTYRTQTRAGYEVKETSYRVLRLPRK